MKPSSSMDKYDFKVPFQSRFAARSPFVSVAPGIIVSSFPSSTDSKTKYRNIFGNQSGERFKNSGALLDSRNISDAVHLS